MVEELKLAIKIDDATIEQSLLKQFANAQKMADKVVLDFKNVNFDDKQIEAKFKEMQKKAGQNPIDFSISGNTLDMLGQIDKRLTEIFSIGKGKSFIDSSSTVSDIGKIENKINELDKKYEEAQKKLSSIGSGGISGKDVNLVDNKEFQKLSDNFEKIKGEIDELKQKINTIDIDTEWLNNFTTGLDEELTDTQAKLDNFINDFNSSFEKINTSTSNTLFNEESIRIFEKLLTSIESSLSSIKGILVDVGDGEELSPLLREINNIQTAIVGLSSSFNNLHFNMNIDMGTDNQMDAKIQEKAAKALNAYEKLFNGLKMSGYGGEVVNNKFFDFDINKFDTTIGKVKAYKDIIERLRKEAKEYYGGTDLLRTKTDDKLWRSASSAGGQLTQAINETTKNKTDNPLTELFGKTDLSGVIEQLNTIVSKLDEISVSAKGFTETFKNGLNVNASVEEIEKLTNRVKELETELAKIKTPTTVTTPQESNISSGNSAEQYKQITADTVSVLSDVGKTEDQIISKIQQERKEAEKNNEVLREHLVLLDSAGKVVANHLGSTSNVNGTFSNEQLSQANDGKIIHAHPGKASFFGGKDLQNLFQNSMYDQIKQIELVWGDSSLSIDKSTLTKESSSTILNIMRNVRKTLTEVYGDNEGGMPSQEAREHINAIEKEIFKTISQKLNVSVSENGSMANEVTESLSDIDKAIIKRFQGIKSSVVQDIDASDIIKSQMKDAFLDKDVSTSVESATNSIKEENNALEQNTQKVKENTQAKEQNANVNLNKYDKRLDSYNGKVDKYQATIARFNDGGWTSDEYLKNVQAVKDAVNEYETLLNELKGKDVSLVTSDDISKLDEYDKKIKDTIATVTNMSAAEKGYNFVSGQKELDKIHKLLNENSKMSSEAKAEIRAYYTEIESGNPSMSLDRIHGEIMKIYNAEVEAGRAGRSFFDTLKNSGFHQIAAQMAGMFGLYDAINLGKEGFNVVRELNTALTEMRKVSDESIQTLKDYQKESFNTADAIATTGLQMQNSIADWQRLGYSINEANELAKNSNIYKNVGDMDISTATEHMVSSVQAWKSEFNDDAVKTSEEVMNRYNKIGNEFAISSANIGEAMETSAAALKAGGNDLNEALGIITAGNIIQQDASTTSSAMKILSLRIRGAKADLESMGESTDDLTDSTSKLREEIKGLTGVDIMADEDTFKSTAEIIKEIGAVWDQLSDVSQAATLEKLAGKNRASTVAGLIENYETIDKVIEAASNADNSALDENQKIIESIDGRIQQLSNRVQEFWYNLVDDSVVKSAVSALTTIVEGGTKLIDTFGTLPTLLTTIGAGLSLKNIGKCYVSA